MGVTCIHVLRARDKLKPGGLADSALTGIRESTTRYKVPAVREILRRQSPRPMAPSFMPKALAGVEKIGRGLAPRLSSLGHEQLRKLLVFHVTTVTRGMHAARRFPHAIIGKEPTRPQAVGELYITRWLASQK